MFFVRVLMDRLRCRNLYTQNALFKARCDAPNSSGICVSVECLKMALKEPNELNADKN
jgi:hypothetical protein